MSLVDIEVKGMQGAINTLRTQLTLDQHELHTIGDELARGIYDNTSLGQDFHGNDFAPYAESTVKKRQKQGLNVGKPDLRMGGKMLSDMVVETDVAAQETTLTFHDPQSLKIAEFHMKGNSRGMPVREFFGPTKEAIDRIYAYIRKVFQP